MLNKSRESAARAAAAAAAAAESDEEVDESEEEDESGDEAIEAQRYANEAVFYSEVEAAFFQRVEAKNEAQDGGDPGTWMVPGDLKEAIIQVCHEFDCLDVLFENPENRSTESLDAVCIQDKPFRVDKVCQCIRVALQVCNRAFSDSECSAFLRSLKQRTWGNGMERVSLDDFLSVARIAIEQGNKADEEVHAAAHRSKANKMALKQQQQQQQQQQREGQQEEVVPLKGLNFWDTKTGQQAIADGDKSNVEAAGGGMAAARAKGKGHTAKQDGESGEAPSSSSPPNARMSDPPTINSVDSVAAAATFTFDQDSTPGLSLVDASCWALDMGSMAEGSEAEATLWLRNSSPFAARFRCVKRGAKGLARVSAVKQGAVASGAMVPLRVVLKCGGGEDEDTVTVVSEHQELRVIVHAQVFRTKALHR
jgi:hypothetical protein